MSTPATTTPIARTPWKGTVLVPGKVDQYQLDIALFRLTVYREPVNTEVYLSCWDGERLETLTLASSLGIDAAKAEAIRMALRHLANAIISL